jgi:hypothetical protein
MMPKVEFYELKKVAVNQGVTTASIWGCSLCGAAISGMGGPNRGTLCVSCGDAITGGAFDRGELLCRIEPWPVDGGKGAA